MWIYTSTFLSNAFSELKHIVEEFILFDQSIQGEVLKKQCKKKQFCVQLRFKAKREKFGGPFKDL